MKEHYILPDLDLNVTFLTKHRNMPAYSFHFEVTTPGCFHGLPLEELQEMFADCADAVKMKEKTVEFIFSEETPIRNLFEFRKLINSLCP